MRVLLVGQPNSGKSAMLAKLTGARVIASNYPGTTVEVARGKLVHDLPGEEAAIEIIDTPGIYSLKAVTGDEKVTRDFLSEDAHLIVNVVDGTNLERHLHLTLALSDYAAGTGTPIIVAINHFDSMTKLGIRVDAERLKSLLGRPVLLTSALTGEGISELARIIKSYSEGPAISLEREGLPADTGGESLRARASRIAGEVVTRFPGHRDHISEAAFSLDRVLDKPAFLWGSLLFLLGFVWKILSWSLPLAETAVRFVLSPLQSWLRELLRLLLPAGNLQTMLREALPEGLLLPLGTVLPAMTLAYLFVAFFEDTGLLARYAALGDSLLSTFSLPGQALLPIVLGLGCRVPGIIATRTLPTVASRRKTALVIANLVPCTATTSLGWVVLAKFGGNPLVPLTALSISFFVLTLGERFISGRSGDPLVLELPPLRIPIWRNIAMKTEMRLQGFFSHVLPLVMLMNIGVRIILDRGRFPETLSSFSWRLFGISPQALLSVFFTMAQRYLAPLFLLHLDLGPREATIAVTMVALGFPCLPSVVTLWRELGFTHALLSFLLGFLLFLGWGVALNRVLPAPVRP